MHRAPIYAACRAAMQFFSAKFQFLEWFNVVRLPKLDFGPKIAQNSLTAQF